MVPFRVQEHVSLPQDGRTALMSASRNGHSKVVEMLLAAGAQPDHQKDVRNLASMSLKTCVISERVNCLLKSFYLPLKIFSLKYSAFVGHKERERLTVVSHLLVFFLTTIKLLLYSFRNKTLPYSNEDKPCTVYHLLSFLLHRMAGQLSYMHLNRGT